MHLYASDLPNLGTDRKLGISAIDRCHSRSLTISKKAFLVHFKNTIFSGHHIFFLFFHHFSGTKNSPNIFENFRIYWQKPNIWHSHSIYSVFDFVLKYFHQDGVLIRQFDGHLKETYGEWDLRWMTTPKLKYITNRPIAHKTMQAFRNLASLWTRSPKELCLKVVWR